MPQLSDRSTVRRILNRDRAWAAYAIGDLAPGFIDHCEWRTPADADDALLLVYNGFTPPIAFAMGDAPALARLFREAQAPELSLHIQPPALPALRSAYEPTFLTHMHRMVVDASSFTPVPHADVRTIGEHDVDAVLALYQDGHRRGEGPAFFSPAMLGQGSFRGVWQDGTLIAVAGTHLYSREEGVCAIGNVYTHSDCRGRGLAARVTSAVVAQALHDAIPTIVLNVGAGNVAAQRVYERLGFTLYCEFLEGEARRQAEP